MKKFYADGQAFKKDIKYEFERLWPTELSMYSPLDTMPSFLRDKIKDFAFQLYFRGAQETMLFIEEEYPDWDKTE